MKLKKGGAFVDITKKSRLSGAFTGKPTKVRVGGVWKSDNLSLPLNSPLGYSYTGAAQLIVVPAGANALTVDISGAQGGAGDGGGSGGLGGRIQASIPVTPGETLQLNVGQQGVARSGAGSFGGGGGGGTDSTPNAGGGGGATDIRRGAFALADRLVVAGGGGGNINNDTTSKGGLGGGLVGGDGSVNGVGTAAGKGGTQSAGGAGGTGGLYGAGTDGALGQGGNGKGGNRQGGGGGGGYYGGGGGTGDVYISDHPSGGNGGGGGGSSYAVPAATGVTHTQGFRAGNGIATITFLAVMPNLLVSENFDKSNGAVGSPQVGPNPISIGTVSAAPVWSIVANQLTKDGAEGVLVWDSGQVNHKVTATLTAGNTGGSSGVAARVKADGSELYTALWNPANNDYVLYRKVGSVWTLLDTFSASAFRAGDSIGIRVAGRFIQIFRNDVVYREITDTVDLVSTNAGVYGSAGPSGVPKWDAVTIFKVPFTGLALRDKVPGVDSSSSAGSAESGQLWVPAVGTWGRSGNQLYTPVSSTATEIGGVLVADVNDSVQEAILTIPADIGNSTGVSIAIRYQDLNNFWFLEFYKTLGGDTKLYAGKIVGGVMTYSILNALTIATGFPFKLKLKATAGNVITASTKRQTLDWVDVGSAVTDAALASATKMAVGIYGSTVNRIDDVYCYTPSGVFVDA